MNNLELIDGKSYLITFNNGSDCVEAAYMAEYNIFSHLSGSISFDDAERIEQINT